MVGCSEALLVIIKAVCVLEF